MRTSVYHTVLAVALLGVACQAGDPNSGPVVDFKATLVGGNEQPPVTSAGTAKATFSVSGSALTYTLEITGAASSAYTAAHIHSGTSATTSGTIRVNLCGAGTAPACPVGAGTVTGTTSTVSGITFDALVAQMQSYGAYVNLHTVNNPGGEIRGEIIPAPPL